MKSLGTTSVKRVNLSEKLFSKIANILNDVHETHLSDRFFRIFLEDHVRCCVNQYKLLNKDIRNDIKPHTYSLNYQLLPPFLRYRHSIVEVAKHLLTLNNEKQRDLHLKDYDHITIGFSRSETPVKQSLCKEIPEYFPFLFGSGDNSKRQTIYDISDHLNSVFEMNVMRLIPKMAVEYFDQFFNHIKLIDPGKKQFHCRMLRIPEYYSIFVAKYVEYGSRLIWYQHGVEPAELAHKYSRWYQYCVSDEYKTWGWKELDKDTPWIAYPILDFKKKYIKTVQKTDYDLMLCYPSITPINKEKQKSITSDLLSGLSSQTFSSILARPYPLRDKSNTVKQLEFINDSRVMVNSSMAPIIEDISSSRLVIQMEIPSTNFAECLSVDHPSVGIIINDQPNSVIQPWYEYLKLLKIYHTSAESLAEHLNSINIEEWWAYVTEDPHLEEYKQMFLNEDLNNHCN